MHRAISALPTSLPEYILTAIEVKGNERTAYVNGNMVFTQDNLRITADNGSFNWKTKNAVFSGNVTVNGTPHTGDLTYNVRDKKFL